MSKIFQIKESTLKNIIDITKTKLGTSKTIKVKDIASNIAEIPSAKEELIQIYSGEPTYSITTAFSTGVSLDNTNKTQGKSSLKIVQGLQAGSDGKNDVGIMFFIKFSSNINLSNVDKFMFDLYIPQPTKGHWQINFCTGTNEDGFNYAAVMDTRVGWNRFTFTKDDAKIIAEKNPDWANISQIRITWIDYQHQTPLRTFYFDNFVAYN